MKNIYIHLVLLRNVFSVCFKNFIQLYSHVHINKKEISKENKQNNEIYFNYFVTMTTSNGEVNMIAGNIYMYTYILEYIYIYFVY